MRVADSVGKQRPGRSTFCVIMSSMSLVCLPGSLGCGVDPFDVGILLHLGLRPISDTGCPSVIGGGNGNTDLDLLRFIRF